MNTASYCTETINQLESIIQDEIDKAFAEHIDMTSESESFYDVISSSITILVSSAVVDLEPSLSAMEKMSWDSVDKVADSSEYVTDVKNALENAIPITRNTLASVYFRGFCDRFASVFLPRFSENIFKCKHVNEMAAQQLLLDINVVKDLMLSIPTLGLDEEAAEKVKNSKRSMIMNATFMKLVNQSFSKTEVLVKIIGTPKAGLADSFKMFWYVSLKSFALIVCPLTLSLFSGLTAQLKTCNESWKSRE